MRFLSDDLNIILLLSALSCWNFIDTYKNMSDNTVFYNFGYKHNLQTRETFHCVGKAFYEQSSQVLSK